LLLAARTPSEKAWSASATSAPSVPNVRTTSEKRRLGETGPLSQGVQAGRKALRKRYTNDMEVRQKRPRRFKKRPRGFKRAS
jgi:hypothetical protein